MPALSFPASPTVGQTYSANGRTWTWTGAAWELVAASGGGSLSATVTIPGLGDPQFGNVALLLKMEGTGGTFVDSSGVPKSVTAVGNATHSATQSRFGSKSLQCPAGGYLSVNGGDGFSFGTGDFTVELFAYPTETPNGSALFTSEYGDDNQVGLTLAFSNSGTLGSVSGATLFAGFYTSNAWRGISSTSTLTLNQWNHVAVIRLSGEYSLYLNGTRIGTSVTPLAIPNMQTCWIGKDWGSASATTGSFVGFIDEVRVTKGIARYSGEGLVVPTAEFATSSSITVPVVFS
jgi:hypothetical protein